MFLLYFVLRMPAAPKSRRLQIMLSSAATEVTAATTETAA
jgi:hypothetical protein